MLLVFEVHKNNAKPHYCEHNFLTFTLKYYKHRQNSNNNNKRNNLNKSTLLHALYIIKIVTEYKKIF